MHHKEPPSKAAHTRLAQQEGLEAAQTSMMSLRCWRVGVLVQVDLRVNAILSFVEPAPFVAAELGIDLPGIFNKAQAILLHRLNNRVLEELDMGGALVFVLLLGGLHLLVRPCGTPGGS